MKRFHTLVSISAALILLLVALSSSKNTVDGRQMAAASMDFASSEAMRELQMNEESLRGEKNSFRRIPRSGSSPINNKMGPVTYVGATAASETEQPKISKIKTYQKGVFTMKMFHTSVSTSTALILLLVALCSTKNSVEGQQMAPASMAIASGKAVRDLQINKETKEESPRGEKDSFRRIPRRGSNPINNKNYPLKDVGGSRKQSTTEREP
ncbi:hypothetical protein IGI04_028049 [Brassica rapa subsp. trilocularis]|uniref:Uncharacterized protein n=1 Tax=Brassica rapa subsp. trilocularis TaxID=1813537 RepID=A0ABQ7L0V2_BRACM|nr:hypothetical protein IGI04_028049 [Brassica rapa subsp. trilocularis]